MQSLAGHALATKSRVAGATRGDEQRLRELEDTFDQMRLAQRVAQQEVSGSSALVAFPTVLVWGGRVHDLEMSHEPGIYSAGTHRVEVSVVVDGLHVSGSFFVGVGVDEVPDAHYETARAGSGRAADAGSVADASAVVDELPCSIAVPALTTGALRRQVRRAHADARVAAEAILASHRGLVVAVVNRYRALIGSEATSIDLDDLMLVGEHQLLDVVDRLYASRERRPPRGVAWSKVVQRAVGNAVRTEIARATGISVEFRQLLAWFHANPADREAPSHEVAYRMAHATGVTRLMAQRNLSDRALGAALLDEMLVDGRARYIAPGKSATTERRIARQAGIFTISPRSSIAEIERAQQFAGAPRLGIDIVDPENASPTVNETILAQSDQGYAEAESRDVIRRTIETTGMSGLEALVWLQRSGALDPGGHGAELPEIAEDLGLSGRSEARAALRRARRKLEAVSTSARTAMLATG